MLARGHRDRSPLRSRSIISQHLPTRSTMRPPPGHCSNDYVSNPTSPNEPSVLSAWVCQFVPTILVAPKKSNVSHSLACPGPLLTLLLLSKDARCC